MPEPITDEPLDALLRRIRACDVCDLPHGPRPVLSAGEGARLVIIGQAPGSKVHASGVPWDDDSGRRLREWLALEESVFYDPERVCILPMGFCYPGKGDGGDLPPRKECAPLWHEAVLARLPRVELTLLVGLYAQQAYLPGRMSMTARVRGVRETLAAGAPLPERVALPHPAWRSRMWMKKQPWFEAEVLPALRARVAASLHREE